LAKEIFIIAEDYLKKTKDPTYPSNDEAKYAVSIGLATILDMMHLHLDLNGRTSEDWMVEYQRRLFGGDMNKIVTWSENSLRSNDLSDTPRDYLQEYGDRELLLRRRGRSILQFKAELISQVLNKISITAEDPPPFLNDLIELQRNPDSLNAETKETRINQMIQVLYSRPGINTLITILNHLLRGIDSSQMRREFKLETDSEDDPPGVINLLMDAKQDHEYHYQIISSI
jgi:hypothetical protein